jgi:hypothetical protein
MRTGGEGAMNAIDRQVSGEQQSAGDLPQYEDYTEYKCLYCYERCINKVRSVPARANLCRKCIQNPAAFIHGRMEPEEFQRQTEDYDD